MTAAPKPIRHLRRRASTEPPEPRHVCGDCGSELQIIRPGKYQCVNPKCGAMTKAKITIRQKSELMTDFLKEYEKITKKRITVDEIHSPEYVAMRDAFIKLFMPLITEKG
jgi:hypothetical protein